ncbi:MAG: transcription termination/antitermination NusG family protein [Sphaerochaeta sp.]
MYFCLNCITGREEETKANIAHYLEDRLEDEFLVWFPKKEALEKRSGRHVSVAKPLFPSYLFIYWEGENEREFPFYELRRLPTVIRILGYDDNSHSLKGKDLSFAKWIHMYGGYIRKSKVIYREGQRLHICEGPLKGFDGNVVKVDRHHKKITLRFEIGGVFSEVNFSADFISASAESDMPSADKI